MTFTPPTKTEIQASMRAVFPQVEGRLATYYGMQEYHLGWRDLNLQPANEDPGKLVRPNLALLACQAVGGDPQQALPLAAALQLIHDFSLIHDDIEDNSDLRRGRPTVWNHWGLAHGINAGDGMFVLAHLALLRLQEAGVPAERIVAAMRRFDETILIICEGQFLDLSFEGDRSITVDDYLAMIGRKTAALIDASAALGALVGGGSAAAVAALGTFGRSLGLAFQIQDDVLGIWGDPARTGKPFAADLYRRKLSLPVLYALAQPNINTELSLIYANEPDAAAVARALELLDLVGARTYTEAMAAEYHQQALAALAALPPSDDRTAQQARAALLALAESLLGRQA